MTDKLADELWERYATQDAVTGNHLMTSWLFKAALREYGQAVRKRDAEICRGVTLDYINSHHYAGWIGGRNACAAAIESDPLP